MASTKAGEGKKKKRTLRIISVQFAPQADTEKRLEKVYRLLLTPDVSGEQASREKPHAGD